MPISTVVLIALATGCLGLLLGRYSQRLLDRFRLQSVDRSEPGSAQGADSALSTQARLSLYQKVIDTMEEAVIVRDTSGAIIYFNDAWRQFTDSKDADLYGEKEPQNNRFMLADGVTPAQVEDTPMYQAQRGLATKYRFLYLSTDKQTPVLVSGYPLRDDERTQIGSMAVVQDVSEIRNIELELERERVLLHTIIKVLPDAFVCRNMSGQAILVNDAMRQLRDLAGDEHFMEAVVHGNFTDSATGAPLIEGQTPIERALRGEVVMREEVIQERVGEHSLNLLATAIPVYDNNDRQYGAISILQDITALKKATEHRDKTRRAEALHNLAAGLAHDFNNHLSMILGNAQLALAEKDNYDSVHHHLQTIVDIVQSSAELTRRLLTLGNTSGGKLQQLNLQQVLEKFVATTLAVFETYIDFKLVDTEPDLYIYCDRSQLESALLNLLLNAKDATASTDRPRVRIRVKRLGAHKAKTRGLNDAVDYVAITVQDNGEGFSSQSREEAFDPFYSTKMATGGTGLGLTVVDGFVRRFGGQVTISDKFSELTSVEMVLPLVDASELETLTHGVDQELLLGHGEKVLIVEDRPEMLSVVCEMLSVLNYRIVCANSAEQGLLRLKEDSSIELVLVDVMLGEGMSGVEMMEVAYQKRPDILVIYTSGYAGNRREITLPDDQPFLQKPVEMATLSRMMRQQLGRSAASQRALPGS